jgi:ubiquitin-like modifier-activating enzyme ATG7
VSYSNPVRQSLFNFVDCLEGGQPKAEAAARSLAAIFPGVRAEGINLNIPLPGHPISEGLMEETRKNFEALNALIQR